MKLSVIISCLVCFGGMLYAQSPSINHNYIEYQIDEGQYGVIYFESYGESLEQTEEKALLRAAEVTLEEGYLYFHIDQAEEVLVAHSGDPVSIPQSTFDDENYSMQGARPAGVYTGVKLTFTCTNTPSKQSYDAAAWTSS